VLGDAVYGATNDQFVVCYAEYALVEASTIAPSPPRSIISRRRAFRSSPFTAWQMLFEYARIEPGQAILRLLHKRPSRGSTEGPAPNRLIDPRTEYQRPPFPPQQQALSG
jgi:hypothetical protein